MRVVTADNLDYFLSGNHQHWSVTELYSIMEQATRNMSIGTFKHDTASRKEHIIEIVWCLVQCCEINENTNAFIPLTDT